MDFQPTHSRALLAAIPAGVVATLFVLGLIAIFEVEAPDHHPLMVVFFAPSLVAGFLIGRFWAVALAVGSFAGFALLHGSQPPWTTAVPGIAIGALMGVLANRAVLAGSRPAGGRQAAPLGVRLRQLSPPLLVRRAISRERVDNILDLARFRLDRFPRGVYQPVSALPVRVVTRADGCESRWEAMLPVVDRLRPRSALDVGANVGFFSLNLGGLGIPTVSVDGDPVIHRTAMLALRRSGVPDVGVLYLKLTPENVRVLPAADCVVFLSVWHHVVRSHGLAQATAVLRTLWSRTGAVMFFDTGEDEMPESFGLPEMGPDARGWLSAYLASACTGADVEHLGSHAAFDAAGRPCRRNLFAIVRAAPVGDA